MAARVRIKIGRARARALFRRVTRRSSGWWSALSQGISRALIRHQSEFWSAALLMASARVSAACKNVSCRWQIAPACVMSFFALRPPSTIFGLTKERFLALSVIICKLRSLFSVSKERPSFFRVNRGSLFWWQFFYAIWNAKLTNTLNSKVGNAA